MPLATYKTYRCQICGYTKTLYQGDVITSFPICPKCETIMELTDDDMSGGLFDMLIKIFKKDKHI